MDLSLFFPSYSSYPFAKPFVVSVTIGLWTGLLAMILGAAQAFVLCRTEFAGRRWLLFFGLVPFLIPGYVHALAWCRILAPNSFLVPYLPDGLVRLLNGWLYSQCGVVALLAFHYHPIVLFVVTVGMLRLDPYTEEAALLIYPPAAVFLKLVVKQLLPYLCGSALLVFVLAIMDFSVPDILRVQVLVTEIFVQLGVFYDQLGAFLLALPLLLVASVLLIFLRIAVAPPRSSLHTVNRLACAGTYVPGMIVNSLGVAGLVSFYGLVAGVPCVYLLSALLVSPDVFVTTICDSLAEITYSAVLSCLSSALAVCLALWACLYMRKMRTMKKTGEDTGSPLWLSLLVFMPFAVPHALLALGLLSINRLPVLHHLSSTSIPCIVGLTLIALPFGFVVIEIASSQIDRAREEIALFSCASAFRRFFRIVLPALAPGIAVSFLFMFLLSLGDLSLSLLLVPSGRETVPVKIYNIMHYGADDMVAALCLFLIVGVLALYWMTYQWMKLRSSFRF